MENHNVKTLIFNSSANIYGSQNIAPMTEDMPISYINNSYGRSKHIIEQILNDVSFAHKDWSIILLR